MSRKARIDAPGALHHIIIRGIERNAIFKDDSDRDNFLDRLSAPVSVFIGVSKTGIRSFCSQRSCKGPTTELQRADDRVWSEVVCSGLLTAGLNCNNFVIVEFASKVMSVYWDNLILSKRY